MLDYYWAFYRTFMFINIVLQIGPDSDIISDIIIKASNKGGDEF